jgi:hypothetical protein
MGGELQRWTRRLAGPPVSTTGHSQSRDRREGECDATHQLHDASFPVHSVNPSDTANPVQKD